MNAVIIEDERLAAERLVRLLTQVCPDLKVIAMLESVEQSINWLSANPSPDILFMDIQLDDGLAFEIFDNLKLETPVIFTTAYNEYALRAFKVNSIDYLLKPIEKEALQTALDKFRKTHKSPEMDDKLVRVLDQFSKQWKTRFFVKVGQRFLSVPVIETNCFFVEEHATFLKTRENKTYSIDYSLDQIQKRLDPDNFFRINRNYIINIHAIREIVVYSSNRLKIKVDNCRGEDLIVSRDKVADFKQWLDR